MSEVRFSNNHRHHPCCASTLNISFFCNDLKSLFYLLYYIFMIMEKAESRKHQFQTSGSCAAHPNFAEMLLTKENNY